MTRNEPLAIIDTHEQWVATQRKAIADRAAQVGALEILEAGCGRRWLLELGEIKYRLTGIDLDADALRHRIEVMKDLDEGVHGDLSVHDFGGRQFDVVYSAYVLEHIRDADRVMKKLANCLKPGGVLLLQIPDPRSAYGFVTRFSPHWFHVMYYRYIYGMKDAGKPGFGPYRTYYEAIVSRRGIRQFCSSNSVTMIGEYGTLGGLPSKTWRRFLIRFGTRLVAIASLGRLSAKHVNLLYVIRKDG